MVNTWLIKTGYSLKLVIVIKVMNHFGHHVGFPPYVNLPSGYLTCIAIEHGPFIDDLW